MREACAKPFWISVSTRAVTPAASTTRSTQLACQPYHKNNAQDGQRRFQAGPKMLDPVELQLFPSCYNCISWSSDGELAVAAGEYIHILVSIPPTKQYIDR